MNAVEDDSEAEERDQLSDGSSLSSDEDSTHEATINVRHPRPSNYARSSVAISELAAPGSATASLAMTPDVAMPPGVPRDTAAVITVDHLMRNIRTAYEEVRTFSEATSVPSLAKRYQVILEDLRKDNEAYRCNADRQDVGNFRAITKTAMDDFARPTLLFLSPGEWCGHCLMMYQSSLRDPPGVSRVLWPCAVVDSARPRCIACGLYNLTGMPQPGLTVRGRRICQLSDDVWTLEKLETSRRTSRHQPVAPANPAGFRSAAEDDAAFAGLSNASPEPPDAPGLLDTPGPSVALVTPTTKPSGKETKPAPSELKPKVGSLKTGAGSSVNDPMVLDHDEDVVKQEEQNDGHDHRQELLAIAKEICNFSALIGAETLQARLAAIGDGIRKGIADPQMSNCDVLRTASNSLSGEMIYKAVQQDLASTMRKMQDMCERV